MSELIHVTATDDQLLAEALHISEHRAQPYLSQERKAGLSLQLKRVLFEIRMRDGKPLVQLEMVDERAAS